MSSAPPENDSRKERAIVNYRFRRLHLYLLVALLLAIYADAFEGNIQARAVPGLSSTWLAASNSLLVYVLTFQGLYVALGLFYRAGGLPLQHGGRIQFAHARGYAVSFYIPVTVQIVAILAYPYVRPANASTPVDLTAISLTCLVLTGALTWVIAKLLFRRVRNGV